jgi:hypothetical protein
MKLPTRITTPPITASIRMFVPSSVGSGLAGAFGAGAFFPAGGLGGPARANAGTLAERSRERDTRVGALLSSFGQRPSACLDREESSRAALDTTCGSRAE